MSRGPSQILRASAVVMASSFTISGLGFLKSLMAAYFFGTSGTMDAYLLALVLPDLVMNLALTGGFNFIPVFASERARSEQDAWQTASKMLTYWLVILAAALVIAVAFTPQFMSVLAPGFSQERRAVTMQMSRILVLMAVAEGGARILALSLYAQKKFVAAQAGEVLFQAASIAYLVAFRSWGILALVWGMVFGGFVQMLVVALGLLGRRRELRLSFDLRSSVIHRMFRLVLPTYIGASSSHLNAVINRAFASFLPAGAVSSLQYASLLVEAPQEIVANSLGRALFTFLSHQFVANGVAEARKNLTRAVLTMAMFFLPLTIGGVLLARPVVRILFERGSFDARSVFLTSSALQIYALGMLATALNTILSAAFHARQDTTTPMRMGLIRVAANALFCFVLAPRLGHRGVALGTVLAEYVKLLLFALNLGQLFSPQDIATMRRAILRLMPAVGLMGVVVYLAGAGGAIEAIRFGWHGIGLLLGLILLGVTSYAAGLSLFCSEELAYYAGLLGSNLAPAFARVGLAGAASRLRRHP